jgi:hypothetical protein
MDMTLVVQGYTHDHKYVGYWPISMGKTKKRITRRHAKKILRKAGATRFKIELIKIAA